MNLNKSIKLNNYNRVVIDRKNLLAKGEMLTLRSFDMMSVINTAEKLIKSRGYRYLGDLDFKRAGGGTERYMCVQALVKV